MESDMYTKVSLNVDIQTQYFHFLSDFLDSELAALRGGSMTEVFVLEKSIHSLIRSIHKRRCELQAVLAGGSLRQFASELPESHGGVLRHKIESLSLIEEACTRKATRNAEFSIVMADMTLENPLPPVSFEYEGLAAAMGGRQ